LKINVHMGIDFVDQANAGDFLGLYGTSRTIYVSVTNKRTKNTQQR